MSASVILVIILSVVFMFIGNGFIIWVVGKFGLGLEVDNFGSAFTAAIVIAIVSVLAHWLFGFLNLTGAVTINWLAHTISLIVAGIILMISDKFVKGMRVKGFLGALVASVFIALFSVLSERLVNYILTL
ncbi:MAG: phage holin family protein [Anaerolineales bacterium]|nr:phage holin family protein [Anaerolineales bacterium]